MSRVPLMPSKGLSRIAHATDFSPSSAVAFEHALRLAVAAKCRLDLLHVHDPGEEEDWAAYPHVRETLTRWEMIENTAQPEDIEPKVGVHVSKIEIASRDPVVGLSEFLLTHRPDLLVVATHGRQGINRLLTGSVSLDVVKHANIPTLLIGPKARGFVDALGTMKLGSVLVPVAEHPGPAFALDVLATLLMPIGLALEALDVITVGQEAPDLLAVDGQAVPVRRVEGAVPEAIVAEAKACAANLIVMPTSGHHGFLDGLRGSTTARVVAEAPCPVLSLPLRNA